MSQSEFAARRMAMGAEAAKGCESFLCEQRIESNWRILLTIDFTVSLHKEVQGDNPTGSALERENAVRRWQWPSAGLRWKEQSPSRRRSFPSGRASGCQLNP